MLVYQRVPSNHGRFLVGKSQFFFAKHGIINANHLDMGDFPVPSENVQPRSSAQYSSLARRLFTSTHWRTGNTKNEMIEVWRFGKPKHPFLKIKSWDHTLIRWRLKDSQPFQVWFCMIKKQALNDTKLGVFQAMAPWQFLLSKRQWQFHWGLWLMIPQIHLRETSKVSLAMR